MIYIGKEPIQILWDMVKDLRTQIPIYKEIMHEDDNDIPASYILLRSQMSDTTENFGDGKSLIRSADCDIILVSKGYADDTTDLHNKNKKLIRQQLKDKEISFDEFNLGYDDGLKSTQHTFSLGVNYIG
jgi:hypothetical protein